MTKALAIFFLTGCFFFKDAVIIFFSHEYLIYSAEDAAKTDPSDNKEKDGEEKSDEYKIGFKTDQLISTAGGKKTFYHAHELNYFQHCLEINSPPPRF